MNCRRVAAGVAAALLAGTAAAEVEYGVEVGVGTSDNIRRVPVNEDSETILTTGADLRWLREEGLLNADVDLELDYNIYQDDAYDSEVVGMANADFRLRFMPDRFEWVLTDRFGQAQTNPFVASTPDSRENINYFSTGPDLTFRLGSVAYLTLFGRYSMTDYEDSNFDDQRALAGLSIGRNLSQRSKLSLNATTERIEFDDELLGIDFDRQSYYLAYEADGARTQISAQAGYTEIHDDFETRSYPLAQLIIARDVSPRSVLRLSGGVRSSDAGSALGGGFGGTPTTPDRISTTDTFEMRHARIGWEFTAPRTVFMTAIGYEEDIYDNAIELDRKRQILNLLARRQLTPRISLEGVATLFSDEFELSGQEDDEMQLGIHLSWNATGRLFIDLDFDHYERDSSVDTTDFDENRVFLRFAWRSTGEPPETR